MSAPGCLVATLLANSRLTATYVSNQLDGAIANPETYTSQNIGSGDWLIVGADYSAGSGAIVSGITVGGVSMTQFAASADNESKFFRMPHPGGTTANIVLSFDVSPTRGAMGVWTLDGTPLSWTPRDTLEANSGTIDALEDGVLFGIGLDGSAGDDTWTDGLTLDFTGQLGGDAASGGGAHHNVTTTEAGRTVNTSIGFPFTISIR